MRKLHFYINSVKPFNKKKKQYSNLFIFSFIDFSVFFSLGIPAHDSNLSEIIAGRYITQRVALPLPCSTADACTKQAKTYVGSWPTQYYVDYSPHYIQTTIVEHCRLN